MFRISIVLSLLIGCIVGAASAGLAHLIDFFAGGALPTLPVALAQAALAGAAFALAILPAFRARITRQTDDAAIVRRVVITSTAAFALVLTPLLLIDATASVRWLLTFYALALTCGWLADKYLLPRVTSARETRFAEYLDAVPHAAFVIAALCLIGLTMVLMLANQLIVVNRLANWAFGFLILGVGLATWHWIAPPNPFTQWLRYLPNIGLVVLIVSLLIVGYYPALSAPSRVIASFNVDVVPIFLAGRFGDGDVLISDSPQLKLASVPGAPRPYLDLQPTARGTALWDDLSRALKDKHRVFWVNVPDSASDPQQILAAYLQANGCLDDISATILPVKVYELQQPLTPPRVLPPALAAHAVDAFRSAQVDLGAIRMTGFSFEPTACSHSDVAVALRWQLAQRTQSPLKVSVRLLDDRGRQIQSQDFYITDLQNKTTDQLPAGTQLFSYYLVAIPAGTPPGNYTLAVGVYPAGASQRLHVNSTSGVVSALADDVMLGQVQVYRAEDYQADPYQTLQDPNLIQTKVELRDGLRLDAYGVNAASVLPGDKVSVTARWRALLGSLPPYTVRVRLVQGENIIAETSGAPADGTYPTNLWRAGESVVDRWDLRVPPETMGGKAQLELGVDGGRTLYLADIDVAAITHTFQIPSLRYPVSAAFSGVGDLIGYDLEQTTITPNNPIALTLYWRAGASTVDKNYTVFAQLLAADGHLIAQSDSAPADGQRPTRGWVKNEIIVDRHELNFIDKTYRGNATLIVGLYDPATLVRVPIQNTTADFLKLPAAIQVTAP